MRRLLLGILFIVLVFSASVISISISANIRRVAGGSADVAHNKIKILEVRDELLRINLVRVYVTVLVDVSGSYRVSVTVSNDRGSASGSWTGTLTGGQETTITIDMPPPYLKEGATGFNHKVEVTPL